MKDRMTCACVLAAAVLGLAPVAMAVRAAEGETRAEPAPAGPIKNILEHAKELGLTAEQKTKLEALQKEQAANRPEPGALREKLKDDPESREALKALHEARQSGDMEKIKAAREKAKEKLPLVEGRKPGEMLQKLAAILTPEQMKKLRELRVENGGPGKLGARGGTEEKGNKPDTSKEAPKIFE